MPTSGEVSHAGAGVRHARVGVVVLGMHRSGTSAFTRVLSLLGCDLPATLLGSNKTNETGHWESSPICRLNDRILESAGTCWDDWQAVNPGWMSSPKVDGFRREALDLLQSEFNGSPLFVLKDPRICRLAPFWFEVMDQAGVHPVVISPLRNPLEVAASLEMRNGFPRPLGYLLWLRHVLDAELASRGVARIYATYDQLLVGWAALAARAQTSFGFGWPRYSDSVAAEIDGFLDGRHRHHREAMETLLDNPALPEWLRSSFGPLERWARSGEDPDDFPLLDRIRQEFDAAAPAFARLVAAGETAGRKVGELTRRLEETEHSLADTHLALRDKDQLQDALQRAESALAQRQAEAEQNARQLGEARERISEFTARRSDEEETIKASAIQISALSEELKERLAAQHEAEQALAAAEAGIAQQGDMQGRLQQTQSELAQRQLEAEQATAQATELGTRLAALEAQHEDAVSAEAQLRHTVDALMADLDQAKAQQEALQGRLKDRFEEIAVLTRLLAAAEAKEAANADAQRSHATGVEAMSRLTAEMQRRDKALLAERAEWASSMSRSTAEVKALLENLERTKAANASLQTRLRERFDEVAALSRLLSNAEDRIVGVEQAALGEVGRSVRTILDQGLMRLLPRRLRLRLQIRLLRRSGLVDGAWYVKHYPDIEAAGVDPYWHYIAYGHREGRAPNGKWRAHEQLGGQAGP